MARVVMEWILSVLEYLAWVELSVELLGVVFFLMLVVRVALWKNSRLTPEEKMRRYLIRVASNYTINIDNDNTDIAKKMLAKFEILYLRERVKISEQLSAKIETAIEYLKEYEKDLDTEKKIVWLALEEVDEVVRKEKQSKQTINT